MDENAVSFMVNLRYSTVLYPKPLVKGFGEVGTSTVVVELGGYSGYSTCGFKNASQH